MSFPTIDQFNFNQKRALIRVDFNVPLNENFEITDDTRMRAAIPTIQKILKDGGSIVLMSHLGRPKEGSAQKYSLVHLVKHLAEITHSNVKFADDCIGENANQLAQREAQYKAKFANPFVASRRGYIDDVIMPHETRKRLARSLVMLKHKELENPWRKHDNIPL